MRSGVSKTREAFFTLEGWLGAIPDLKFPAIFRNPLLVARSLRRRSRFALEKGLELWCLYNKKLIHYHNLFGFPIVSFDEGTFQFTKKIRHLILILGLNLDTQNNFFFEHELRHTDIDKMIISQPNV